MNIELTSEEARVIGCLLEKAITTPDQYPLSLNALTNACNQKSSRDPAMSLNQGIVQRTTRQLENKYLLSTTEGKNIEKYTQRFCNTALSALQFIEAEYAIIALLLLRGPQTPGELRSRSGRLHTFADNQEVADSLTTLLDREDGPVVARLSKKQGRQDHEYMHLFCGEIGSVTEEAPIQRAPAREDRTAVLERRIDKLENALISLAETLGEELDLGSPPEGDR